MKTHFNVLATSLLINIKPTTAIAIAKYHKRVELTTSKKLFTIDSDAEKSRNINSIYVMHDIEKNNTMKILHFLISRILMIKNMNIETSIKSASNFMPGWKFMPISLLVFEIAMIL